MFTMFRACRRSGDPPSPTLLIIYPLTSLVSLSIFAQTFVIRHIKDAAATIDKAISTALQRKKPVYLEIPVNVVGRQVATPSPLSMIPPPPVSDSLALKAATDDILQRLIHAVKPVLIAGVKLRSAGILLYLSYPPL